MINAGYHDWLIGHTRDKCVHRWSKEKPLWAHPITVSLGGTLRGFKAGESTHLRLVSVERFSENYHKISDIQVRNLTFGKGKI